MSELVVGILGFACIVALVVTLFKSKTMPSMAFIIFPSILALILVAGGYYSIEQIGDLIKGGFKSTGPTAALFVFSVLFFGIMTDAGMFDVIINKLMKYVGDNVIGVTVMTALIALIGHLDGGGASTFLIVVPAMLPVYKKDAHETDNPPSRSRSCNGCIKPDAMGRSDHACSIRTRYGSRTALGRSDPDPDLWNHSLPGTCGVCRYSGEKERRRSEWKARNGSPSSEDAAEEATASEG